MRSIRLTLLLWLSLALCAGIIAAAGLIYIQARAAANRLFDYQMKQIALSLPHQAFAPMGSDGDALDIGKDVVIQIWDQTGIRIYHSHERPRLPQRAALGFTNVATKDGIWRVFSAQLGETVVQVAQPLSARQELAAKTALNTTAPLLLVLPFMGIFIWLAVGRGLAPISLVASELRARGSDTLTPLTDQGMPEEIAPLTHALNGLLARLERALDAQRAFVADAAHELRTPLAALKLRIQLLERAEGEAERQAAIADLNRGLDRAEHLVRQLLTLSRQETDPAGHPLVLVDLLEVARQIVIEQAPIAAEKDIDLGIAQGSPATISGDPVALAAMLGNLIDNAIRYTPAGGRIDVSVATTDREVLMTVTDTGPGIAAADRQRVFDRFYRIDGSQDQGSGLGLAIVKNVVDRHRGSIHLETGPGGRGLSVSITLPRA
ncbi:swarming motility regulation sensor protein RssA [mine drainage metagenome]|uniref:histidine kinase n=1 Tax=mine drainage metagenome TaxID=410659 RepID=A0A1J5RY03_9ZZZZ